MIEISWLCDGVFLDDLFSDVGDAEDFAESLRGQDVTFVMREVAV